jgi:hypothetical protein
MASTALSIVPRKARSPLETKEQKIQTEVEKFSNYGRVGFNVYFWDGFEGVEDIVDLRLIIVTQMIKAGQHFFWHQSNFSQRSYPTPTTMPS